MIFILEDEINIIWLTFLNVSGNDPVQSFLDGSITSISTEKRLSSMLIFIVDNKNNLLVSFTCDQHIHNLVVSNLKVEFNYSTLLQLFYYLNFQLFNYFTIQLFHSSVILLFNFSIFQLLNLSTVIVEKLNSN